MDFPLRSFDFLGGQSAPRASDDVGVRVLYRCGACGRIWLQNGKQSVLEVNEAQASALAQELSADLAHLPASTCRVCLYQEGNGVIEIDEYGPNKGFGFSWECPHPHLIHALLTIHSQPWLAHLTNRSASLPDVVTHPERMRAVLAWFVACALPRQYAGLDLDVLLQLHRTNPPGFGQPGTEGWQWKGGQFLASCPPLGKVALLKLAVAMPATEDFSLLSLFPLWQSLAQLALLGTVAGETRLTSHDGSASSER